MLLFNPIPTIALGSLHIGTHGLLMAVGFFAAVIFGRRRLTRHGLIPEIGDNVAIVAVLSGLIGARLVYVLMFGQDMSILEMLQVWHGGLSSHGGYFFGIAAGVVYLRHKKLDVLAYTDALMPAFLLGWAFGRIGCFLNWDSYGKITSSIFGVMVRGESRYPTQIFESLIYFLGFVFFESVTKAWKFLSGRGAQTALTLIFFAGVRFCMDFLRDDPWNYLLLSRIVTSAIIIGAVALWYYIGVCKKNSLGDQGPG